ncbi:hypothetical protein C1645_794315, partial [Glomus cerebriforme]
MFNLKTYSKTFTFLTFHILNNKKIFIKIHYDNCEFVVRKLHIKERITHKMSKFYIGDVTSVQLYSVKI